MSQPAAHTEDTRNPLDEAVDAMLADSAAESTPRQAHPIASPPSFVGVVNPGPVQRATPNPTASSAPQTEADLHAILQDVADEIVAASAVTSPELFVAKRDTPPLAPDPALEPGSIDRLDKALASLAEQAVEDEATSEGVHTEVSNAVPAAQEKAPTPVVGATAPTVQASRAPAIAPAAPAPPPPTVAPASPAPTLAASPAAPAPLLEPKPARPSLRHRAGHAASALFAPLVHRTQAMSVQTRQTVSYLAAVTIFMAACLWGFLLFRSDPAAPAATGDSIHFLKPGEKAPERISHKPAPKKKDAHASQDAHAEKADDSHAKPSKSAAADDHDTHGGGEH